MKPTGVVRKLDELGRITLPIELRRNFQIEEKDPLEIYVDGDCIILKKCQETDIFTGSKEDLIEFEGKKVSKATVRKLAELAGLNVSE
ncbi:MAG: AbrB/MazE/SpoVT family DNA-binding domain-containing protein [Lachnospiraceae bacterium]|nr:AbrB/MazE/SpoVT family DNA-binding domain-containing protein [Lachnospiraceae bacterium]MBR6527797.1 AbrB/MazE/SpoVT family DNA-binding domain-containing protein [Lachnospiraceae bacterium]